MDHASRLTFESRAAHHMERGEWWRLRIEGMGERFGRIIRTLSIHCPLDDRRIAELEESARSYIRASLGFVESHERMERLYRYLAARQPHATLPLPPAKPSGSA